MNTKNARTDLMGVLILLGLLSSCINSPSNSRGREGTASTNELLIVQTFEPYLDSTLAARDAAVCETWIYDQGELFRDFMSMRRVTKEYWGRVCYQYACGYKGLVSVNGLVHEVDVNAGGWISLRNVLTDVIDFVVTDEKRSSFIAACNCCV